MEQRQRFYFILPNIDHSTSALFWETGFVTIPVIYWSSNNESVFCVPWLQKDYYHSSCWSQRKVFCILHMLSIHTGLRKSGKRKVFDLHPKKKTFDICVPCIKIVKSELLFEKYIMALNWEKYDTEVRNGDAIKRNRIWFDFMQLLLNCLDGLYLRERFVLVDTIINDQSRKQSAAEIEKLSREKWHKQKKRR